LLAPLVAASSAQAVVVDMNPSAHGQTSVPFGTDTSYYYGVSLVPAARSGMSTTASYLANAKIPYVSSSASCQDPAASGETDVLTAGVWPLISGNLQPLCWHGGSVLHENETFALEWEGPAPNTYWSGTKAFVQQFLSDVASASGALSNPYADTTQYWDGGSVQDRAANASVFGGGCDDNGTAICKFGSTTTTTPGNGLPSASDPNDCSVSGENWFAQGPSGSMTTAANNLCVTDAQIREEILSMVDHDHLITNANARPGYTPLVTVLTPPGVEICVDRAGTLCSANSDPTAVQAQFCSYHSQLLDAASNQEVTYVVQPWTALPAVPAPPSGTPNCDEPDAPKINEANAPPTLEPAVGANLVSPLSQAEIAAIVNPSLNAWFGLDGLETSDENSCQPLGNALDNFTINGTTYELQREFNNAAVVDSDPYTYQGCLPTVILAPAFVVPSAVNPGDVVEFDGSSTASGLIVPNANYHWDFGDGTSAVGPSVVHSYSTGGTYSVTLTVTDRGGNTATLKQTITVLGSNGEPVANPSNPGNPGNPASKTGLQFHILLMPQSLKALLSHGVLVRVSSNARASGIAWVSIPRRVAKRAHIKVGRKPSVVIGVGTVSAIADGTVSLHLKLSRSMAAKLRHLRRVTLTVRLALVGSGGSHLAVDAAGRY
jgi:PKD repeat protein